MHWLCQTTSLGAKAGLQPLPLYELYRLYAISPFSSP